MALAATVNITVLDDKGKSSLSKIRIPNTFTFAQMGEFAADAAQLIAIASNGVITEVNVSVPLSVSFAGLKAVAGILSDVAQKAFFVARSTFAGLFSRFSIPTLDEDKVLDGSDVLDTADADVAAMITAIEDGIDIGLGVFVQPVTTRGNPIAEVSQATELFRKR